MPNLSKKSPFALVLEQALKHYGDPAWLGQHSPLASPYFLGAKLPASAANPTARGRVLQTLLRTCSEQITGRYQERYQTILHQYYMEGHTVDAVSDLVGLGRNSFHLSRNEAIAALSTVVIAQTNPALRLETPPKVGPLIAYDESVAQCLAALTQNLAVTIVGGGGLGKTAVGSTVAKQMQRTVFWFTIAPGLNDYLEAFLFAFGYFLHVHGSSTLWLELVAAGKQPKADRMLNIARYALEQLHPVLPLLCIDEIDLLEPTSEAQHVPLVKFLEKLQGLTPLLLIGQRPLIDTAFYCTLPGLSRLATQTMFAKAGLTLTARQLDQIVDAVQGNPRLIELCIALYQTNDSLEVVLQELSSQPPLEFLLSRMFRRLGETERSLMMELTVFRRPVPVELWRTPALQRALQVLANYRLIYHDQSGGIALLPTYRTLLYPLLPDDKRQMLHTRAALVRAEYGDYAAAVYHLVEVGQFEEAIWLCHEQRQSLIDQGQARRVLAYLQPLRTAALSALAHETLALLCAEFDRLIGNPTKALEDIHSVLWHTPVLALDAYRLAGAIANDESNFLQAETSFRQALAVAAELVDARVSHIHRGLAWRYLRERNLDRAWEEAQRAQYEVTQFMGELQRESANYALAETHFQRALAIAEELQHGEGIAKSCTSLAFLAITQGQAVQTKHYLEKAATVYDRLGKVVQQASLGINWAVAHNLAGEFAQAIAAAETALQQLARLGKVPPRQQGLIDLALSEAYLGLNQLDEATHYAERVTALEDIDLLPDAYRILGEILDRRGQTQDALRFLQMSIQLAIEYEDNYIAAYGWRALGRVYTRQHEQSAAAAAFAEAMALFQRMNLPHEVEKTAQWANQ